MQTARQLIDVMNSARFSMGHIYRQLRYWLDCLLLKWVPPSLPAMQLGLHGSSQNPTMVSCQLQFAKCLFKMDPSRYNFSPGMPGTQTWAGGNILRKKPRTWPYWGSRRSGSLRRTKQWNRWESAVLMICSQSHCTMITIDGPRIWCLWLGTTSRNTCFNTHSDVGVVGSWRIRPERLRCYEVGNKGRPLESLWCCKAMQYERYHRCSS